MGASELECKPDDIQLFFLFLFQLFALKLKDGV